MGARDLPLGRADRLRPVLLTAMTFATSAGRACAALLTALAALSIGSCTKLDSNATAPSCSYSVTPTAANFGNPGGPGTLKVGAAGVCSWSVANEASWITVM